jgi:protein tyrosine phosphatase (PTP) superfamily phosphohydrolase (DUF442 family)/GNAT superfamily N-acetyltransferase
MNWPLRLATPEDVPALEELIPLSVRELQAGCYSPAQMAASLGPVFGVDRQLISDGTCFVVEHERRNVGCGGWSRRKAVFGGDAAREGQDEMLDPQRDPARIRAFFVHPNFARRGIGRTILNACEEAIPRAGYTRIELVATLAGEPLYAAGGYRVLERYEVPLTGGLALPVVRMAKGLAASLESRLSAIRYFLRLSSNVATSGQPEPAEFDAIAAAGFDCVINLALPSSTHALSDEAALVAAQSMEYVHIPVEWEAPRFEDFARFAAALRARAGRRLFAHCAMNMRVSAFMYLHRTLVEGVPPDEAAQALHRIWEPDERWRAFMSEVTARWRAPQEWTWEPERERKRLGMWSRASSLTWRTGVPPPGLKMRSSAARQTAATPLPPGGTPRLYGRRDACRHITVLPATFICSWKRSGRNENCCWAFRRC